MEDSLHYHIANMAVGVRAKNYLLRSATKKKSFSRNTLVISKELTNYEI